MPNCAEISSEKIHAKYGVSGQYLICEESRMLVAEWLVR